eukprot:112527-Rhodomonas_salina.1
MDGASDRGMDGGMEGWTDGQSEGENEGPVVAKRRQLLSVSHMLGPDFAPDLMHVQEGQQHIQIPCRARRESGAIALRFTQVSDMERSRVSWVELWRVVLWSVRSGAFLGRAGDLRG